MLEALLQHKEFRVVSGTDTTRTNIVTSRIKIKVILATNL